MMENSKKWCFECGRMSAGVFCKWCWPNGYVKQSKLNERIRNKAWRVAQNRPHLRFVVTGLKK